MTKDDALKTVLLRYKITAKVVAYDDDDTTSYVPDSHDLDVIETLTGHRPDEDQDLWFTCGGSYSRPEYYLREEFLNETKTKDENFDIHA